MNNINDPRSGPKDPRKPAPHTTKALTVAGAAELVVRSGPPGPSAPERLEELGEREDEAANELLEWRYKAEKSIRENEDFWSTKRLAERGGELIDRARYAVGAYAEDPEAAAINRFTPATWTDIAGETALMIDGFAPPNRDLGNYLDALCRRIASRKPTRVALEMMCRHLLDTWEPTYGRFLPSVPTVLKALEEAETKNSAIAESHRHLPEYINDAEKLLRDAPTLLTEKRRRIDERERAAAAYRAAHEHEWEAARKQDEADHRARRQALLEQYRAEEGDDR